MLLLGYIKLPRSLTKWRWYTDLNTKSVFIHLLLTVNYEDEKWRDITVKRGQRVSSYQVLAEELGLSVRNVRTAIEHLKKTGEVTSQPTPEFSIFTMVHYDRYQSPTSLMTNGRQAADKPSTNDRQQWNKANKAKKEGSVSETEGRWKTLE